MPTATLQAALDEAAAQLAALPAEQWAGWLCYLLEQLQLRAATPEYEAALRLLAVNVDERLTMGAW